MTAVHQAQKRYPERASYDFNKLTNMFVVCCGLQTIAECSDSEVADFICMTWNERLADNTPVRQNEEYGIAINKAIVRFNRKLADTNKTE
jgi:hypothetical protein